MAGDVTDKIKNGLLVWGNASAANSDLAVLPVAENGTVPGAKGGALVYSDELNSGLRSGTLFSYAFLEALKQGPAEASSTEAASEYNTDWYAALDNGMRFDYQTADTAIASFASNLNSVLRQYIKYSQSYFSLRANAWNKPISLYLADYDKGHVGAQQAIDGTATPEAAQDSPEFFLYLPREINANVHGSADDVSVSIGRMALNEVFEYKSGAITPKALAAVDADRAYVAFSQSISGSGKRYILFESDAESGQKGLMAGGDLYYDTASKALASPAISSPTRYGNYGLCPASASTVAKTVAMSGFALADGAHIIVKFSNGNTAANPTLNVNSTGAKAIRFSNRNAPSSENFSWHQGDVLELVYDGTYWQIVGPRQDNLSFAVCSAGASTVAKTASLPGFILQEGAEVTVKFSNANTASNATLNVNSTGAKQIICNGAGTASSAPESMWKAGETIRFAYDGAYWQMVGRMASVSYASEAGSADSADNAVTALYAANAVNLINDNRQPVSAGDAERPVYISAGKAVQGYARIARRFNASTGSKVQCKKANGSGSVESLSFSDAGWWTGIAVATQINELNVYAIECDVRIKADPSVLTFAQDDWLSVDLRSIMNMLGFSSSYYAIDPPCVTASVIRDNLDGFDTPKLICYGVRIGGDLNPYAYVGIDNIGSGMSYSGSSALSAHIAFAITKTS